MTSSPAPRVPTITNRRTLAMSPGSYVGKRERFSDHIGAVANHAELACGARFSGAIGDCTRAAGHQGEHQNGATADTFVEDLTPGTRVTRKWDGAVGTVEYATGRGPMFDGQQTYGVRMDNDGEIWSGTAQAYTIVPPAVEVAPALLTVTIGRNVPCDSRHSSNSVGYPIVPMHLKAWGEFQSDIQGMLSILQGGDVFGPMSGRGEWDGVEEDSTTWTVFLPNTPNALTPEYAAAIGDLLGAYAAKYDQDAIAYAIGAAQLARP